MDRALVAVVTASAIGLALMVAVAHASEPPRVPLVELKDRVGSVVTTAGRIIELDVHETGWTRLLLAEGGVAAEATVGTPPAANPGDVVEATGTVLRKGDRVALRVEHTDDLVVLTAWQDRLEPLRRLAERPWEIRDALVSTEAHLARTGSVTALEDEGRRVRTYGAPLTGFEGGTRVRVEGGLEYDPETFAFRFRVDAARPA